AVIASLTWPVVNSLRRWVPRWLVLVALTAVGVGVIGLLGTGVFNDLRSEAGEFHAQAPTAAHKIEDSGQLGALARDVDLAPKIQQLSGRLADRFQFDQREMGGLAARLGSSASAVLAVWMLALMLVITGPNLVDGMLGAFRPDTAARLRWVLGRAYRRTTRYVGLMGLRAIGFGVVTYAACRFFGVDVPILLAVWVALWAFVPYVGLLMGGATIALVVALHSPVEAMFVLAAVVVVQAGDASFLQRRIDAASMRFGAFLALSFALVGFSLYGPGGLILAVLLAQLGLSILADIGTLNDPTTPDPGARPQWTT
ncbi:MAG TPA: AI-2E family transporter, partial [Candidatus Sulfotelmatobacter sp.]|nr:AI-2E family transporter [Candidatus Sulfotelmatobacter sp.]